MLKEKGTSAREKILDAATNLFFEQGYQGTTIDDVTARSGVSRPTLYTHFSTKEDLGVAYLQLRRQQDLDALKDAIRKEKTPESRYLAPISHVGKNPFGNQLPRLPIFECHCGTSREEQSLW